MSNPFDSVKDGVWDILRQKAGSVPADVIVLTQHDERGDLDGGDSLFGQREVCHEGSVGDECVRQLLLLLLFIGQGYYASTKGRCLVQKRQLLRPALTKELSRGLSDEVLERSGQVRLVEIASLVHHVEDR